MRRHLVVMLALTLAVGATCARVLPAWAEDGSYRDQLISKYPFFSTATGRFAPIYPALAQQIVDDYGVSSGVCVDMGGGCGSLSLALARITRMTIYALDIDPWAVRLCNLLADEAGLTRHVRGIEGDAQNMPFRDEFANLVVSRGSIFFWPDQLAGVREAYRILKPGGVAYIGGGFSRTLDPAIRDQLVQWRNQSSMEGSGWQKLDSGLVERAKAGGIEQIRLIQEPGAGWWLEIRK